MTQLFFLGSKWIGYQCLSYLISNKFKFDIEIIGVITNQERKDEDTQNIIKLCKDHQLKLYKNKYEIQNCDLLISVQYHEILEKEQIDKAKLAINLHMAPLPEYRGCNQFSWAIANQSKFFGTTLHILDEKIDHGDILFENRFPIEEKIWVSELYKITEKYSLELFIDNFYKLLNGDFIPISQKDLLAERGSSLHMRKDISLLKEIDLSWDKEKIERHIRATLMPGFGGPYFLLGDKKVSLSLNG